MSDSVRVGAPDGAAREVVGVTGRKYRSRDGMYDMHPRDARALRKAGGFTPGLGGPVTSGGFACACGFRPLFRTCSRCGSEAVKA